MQVHGIHNRVVVDHRQLPAGALYFKAAHGVGVGLAKARTVRRAVGVVAAVKAVAAHQVKAVAE